MRISLMADIHGNREAFEACLRDARTKGSERWVFLGDYVGYGADPAWVVDRVRELVDGGALALRGNHDSAVSDLRESMTAEAEVAMAWTRGQLGAEARAFLGELPLQIEDGPRLYVHANVQGERRWSYLSDVGAADRAFAESESQTIFCGHVHIPRLYGVTGVRKVVSFEPVAGASIPLLRHRRWLGVLGSVGQPRDGNPAAAYAILDTDAPAITYHRVPYDVEAAAAKIRAAGLPEGLADRLRRGR